MALTPVEIAQAWKELVRQDLLVGQGYKKTDLAAAVAAVDAWATANSASYNTALPEPFKSTATTAQKALLLAAVCMKRAGVV